MDGGSISLFSGGAPKPAKKRRVAPPAPAPDAAEERLAAAEAPLEPAEAGREEHADEEATFRQLGLSEWLDSVCAGLGMRAPTVVQRGTIPAVLSGRDVIGVAHTGSGKTAAFALPILQKLAKDPYGVFALVLTPTRYAWWQQRWQIERSRACAAVGAASWHCASPCTCPALPCLPSAGNWPSSWRTSSGRWGRA